LAPCLQSERLYYKPLSLEHASEEYVRWMNDPDVYRFLETGGDYTMEKLVDYLTGVEANKDILFWAIHLKENNKHIGNIKIDPVNKRHGLGEYGILMGDSSEWGKGYAAEASITIIRYCFEQLRLRKITLGVVKENTGAVALYEKLGFKTEGVYIKHGLYNGRYHDVLRMALFHPELASEAR
jgi:RimJ/RimL family protein N-acetyltransferase